MAPDGKGKYLSVADCHDHGKGQRLYAEAKIARMRELLAMSDKELNMPDEKTTREWRIEYGKISADEIATRDIGFSVMAYPLPR